MEQSKGKIKMVFFDADGALFDIKEYKEASREIAISSWAILFDQLGIYHEHKKLKEMFIQGHFSSNLEWTNEACKVLQQNKLTKEKFLKVINNRPLMKGAEETLRELKNRGYKTAIITGSFKSLAERAKTILNLDDAIAHCDLIFDESGNLKKWTIIDCDFEGKAGYFQKTAEKFGFFSSNCAHVGDEVNDISIFKKAGLGIAFNSFKEEVKKAAHIIIDKKDLREILQYFPSINK